MAELLVKAIDATHSNPAKDARGCYKRGDVVLVRENGHEWGGLELKAPASGGLFVVIKITDVTVAQVLNWVRNNWSCEADGGDVQVGVTVRRRRVKIDVDLVPANVRNTLNQTGQFTTTWAAIRQYVRNKLNNATAQGATL